MEEPHARPAQTQDQMEGDAAHEAAERILTGQVQLAEELIDRKASNGVYITADMIDHVTDYVDHVRGWTAFEEPIDAVVKYVSAHTITGVADAIHDDGDTIRIADFKYGWRPVEVYPNLQLIAYAIGARQRYPDATSFELTIVQPRPYHRAGSIRSHTMTAEDVDSYTHRLGYVLDTRDASTLKTGAHCRYCRARSTCSAVTAATFNAVDVAHNAATDDMDAQALSQTVTDLRRAKELIAQKLDLIEEQAIAKIGTGAHVPGFAVAPSYGQYVWNDGVDAEMIQALTGIDPTEPKLITPAQLKKRGANPEAVKAVTNRPSRGFKLVTSSGADAAFKTAKKG
jgi:hypothetical protein